MFVLVRFTIVMIKHNEKQLWEDRVYFSLYFPTVTHQKKSRQELQQDRDLEAGINPETTKGFYILPYSTWLVHSAFL